ncbi:NADPH-dependent diflavin oxidoreductase 1 isoform X1 [Nicotiana tabacum]|uniref:NADPH-dependent diflavin oxidoreductase 1 n=1 Tax=Nicotiana tabacum TaxID=4097 RepID=A0A1S3ZB79_TOBAC|nr:PREDICTED: NADPH-dependent diflavin oxidoreductase 1-like isoform X1 [Nicotiana tabacum]XP_016461714.1 PREDICTED: NADPH-dependent diflavin oxidoreductase 1-like isoform X1 [Nicotiana tabacum]XP_016461715.1 PREDICTED: NADPH-dependent diflavin oxidoreductase 1-like isoform X1 [Nicotiana tabacum]
MIFTDITTRASVTKSMGMEEKPKKLVILYASQTGNAIDAAERVGREAERRGCPVSLLSIDDFDPSCLPEQEIVIFLVSTTGQGDNPDSIKVFWKFLLQRNLTQNWLSSVSYAVFGLGDSSYQKYNFVAKKLDKRLSDLGATAIVERGLGDDQHPSGYEGALDPWMPTLWKAIYQKNPKLFPKGPECMTSNTSLMDQPKVQITYHDVDEGALQFSSIPVATKQLKIADFKLLEMQIESTRFILPGKLSGKHPPDCFLKMVKNDPLSKADSGKDVRHFELEAISSSIEYEVGDVVHILPAQDAAAVDAFMKRCNLNPESYIRVEPRDNKENGQSHDLRNTLKVPIRLKTFVELAMDVASASPRRYFFEVMSYFATAEHEKERLQYFASPEGRDDLYEYSQKERRTVLEVLEDFPSVQMPFEWLVQLVPPLKTRAFSISSSHSVHPNQVHLTVSVVSWTTPYKRKRTGLCSSWLAGLDPQKRVLIPAWFQKGSLPSPPPSLPVIVVGPGTGCAPFRGFVEERALQSQSGPTAPLLFFFGCRNEENDFLYRDFWLFHSQKGGVLSEEKGGGFFAAFSRDQPQKIHVQHKMREQSVKIWNLLTEGAAVYVAGSANKMPSDVLLAFEEIVSKEGGVPKEAAARWLRALEKAGKYHVEAWS